MPVSDADDAARHERMHALFTMAPAVRRVVASANYSYGPFMEGGEPHVFDARHAADLVPGLFFPSVAEDWTERQVMALGLLTPEPLLIARDTDAHRAELALRQAVRSNNPVATAAAVTAARTLVEPFRGRDPEHSVGNLLLGSALLLSADNDEIWAEGITCLRRASASPVFRFRIESLSRLALAYVLAHADTGYAGQLDAAIEHVRACVNDVTATAEVADRRLHAIATVVCCARYVAKGRPQDNEEAVTQGRAALSGLPADCPYRPLLVMTVGQAVLQRYWRLGTTEDLSFAQQLLHEAVAVVPRDSPNRVFLQAEATVARLHAAATTGVSRPSIQEALRAHARLPAEHPARIMVGLHIADALRRLPWPEPCAQQDSTAEEQSVALLTEGISLTAAMLETMNAAAAADLPVVWGDFLAARGWMLCLRAHRTKNADELNEAVGYAQTVATMPPDETLNRPKALLRAGQILFYACFALGDRELLDEAVMPLREAFRLAAGTLVGVEIAPYRAALALALGEQLAAQRVHDQTLAAPYGDADAALANRRQEETWNSEMDQLATEAVTIVLPLVDQISEEHPDYRYFQWCAGHVINSVQSWHDVVDEIVDQVDPLDVLRRCTAGVSLESPERTEHFLSLVSAEEMGGDGHGQARAARNAALAETRDLRGRLQGAHRWLALAGDGQWSDLPACEAAEAAIALRARVPEAFPENGQRLGVLGEDPWVPQEAASEMVKAGCARGEAAQAIEDAVRVLESGRCTLVRQMTHNPPSADYSLDELSRDAAEGPVVLLNPTEQGCQAILVRADTIELIQLSVTEESATDLHTGLVHALQSSEDAWLTNDEAGQRRAQTDAWEILAEIWWEITGPVLAALGLDTPEPGRPIRRLWWIPAGSLALLPLHAALPRREDPDASEHERLGALGLVTSSYASSLAMLRSARACRSASPPRTRRILAVASSEAPGQDRMPEAEQEVRAILNSFPDSFALTNRAATRNRVLRELSGYPWVHFAGHAASQTFSSNSYMGELLLYDHDRTPLTGLDIAELQIPGAELAFLSACETGTPEGFNTNEAFHLGSAFQLAGYSQVVSTLWPTESFAAVEMAQAFYAQAAADSTCTAAECLQAATLLLREKYPNSPLLWAGHTHSGA